LNELEEFKCEQADTWKRMLEKMGLDRSKVSMISMRTIEEAFKEAKTRREMNDREAFKKDMFARASVKKKKDRFTIEEK
jgi:hypothetical protein